ncbi:MAG: NADH-quinone oxidoreductase subunit I [Chloroflexi bacterium]|nr:NADH-quinone oxidoreductase subunit I [Chloroflexota bacterium]MCH8350835.1 NADH-quinone oxidoreductase subunit I [Chloroflexota bacterium]MCI0786959.1 NADH-quinone oxidoreductase subunit I [Chloroflexota bacterium]MCI0877867.1 NADH-quinone oxidoreductase subunit I [Chloroflexota bacterium]
MLNSLKGLLLTFVSTVNGFRNPVTRQYPESGSLWKRTEVPTPVQPRFMGFPALTWDFQVEEPFCTSCMVCIRQCPTQCMSATMKDNPLHEDGRSSRRKIIDSFEINLNRCILCGICVEVCNFDAIVMSHEHEMSSYRRNGSRVDLPALLEIGTKFQRETGWIPPSELAKKAQAQAEELKDSGESAGGEADVASEAEETEESATSS